jgi:GTP-dependent phosphoenolpyruvate carboxykinase
VVNTEDWLEELKGINRFFKTFKKEFPQELWKEYEALQERLKKGCV